jgi:hypothetical protein
MANFIFIKNLNNVEGTLYRIAENQFDFDNLNINFSDYKIIETSQSNFDDIKYLNKYAEKYNEDSIIFKDITITFSNKEGLMNYVNDIKNQIKIFLDNNKNHSLYNRWNDYNNQLNFLDLDTITYPLNKSLERYFNDLGQPSYNILQLP